MIIRSHEMARHGTEFPFNTNPALDRYYDQEEADVGRGSLTVDPFKATPLPLDHEDPLLVTLFSASNYQVRMSSCLLVVVSRASASARGLSMRTRTYCIAIAIQLFIPITTLSLISLSFIYIQPNLTLTPPTDHSTYIPIYLYTTHAIQPN